MRGRRAVYRRFGAAWEVAEIDAIEIGDPGPGDIVVAVEAACLHVADLKRAAGEAGFGGATPGTFGLEGVGLIVAPGSGDLGLAVGDRVLLPQGTSDACADLCRVPAAGAVRISGTGDPVQLAMASVNPPTAYLLLNACRRLEPGSWVIQNGANAAVGRYAIQLARRQGLRTINVVRRMDVEDELLALGGDVVLEDGDDLPTRVADVLNGAPLPLALDAIAGKAASRLAACLSPDGLVVNYGLMSGDDPSIPLTASLLKGVTLSGFLTPRVFASHYTAADQAAIRGYLADMVARGDLTAKVAATYDLDAIGQALRHAAQTGTARDGKVVVVNDRADSYLPS